MDHRDSTLRNANVQQQPGDGQGARAASPDNVPTATGAPAGTPLPRAAEPVSLDRRFEDRGLIAPGGMSTVRRAYDRQLQREVAIKIIDGGHADGDRALDEALIAARLQHPGIVPIYEIGALDDGRRWLAMRVVEGRDLGELLTAIAAGHEAWSRRRLLDVFLRICQAMAYVHREGVVHRDLKPANIRIGDFGEVVILDWGIACATGTIAPTAGSRGYMAPEQLAGGPVDARVDVFALGVLLGRMLDVTEGDATSDDELARLRDHATRSEPAQRPTGAEALASTIAAWLDGARRRAEARELVDAAAANATRIAALRKEAARLQTEADAILAAVDPSTPAEQKIPGWRLEDEAERRREESRRLAIESEHTLNAALMRADVATAREGLALLYRERVIEAEAHRDARAAAEYLARLRALAVPAHAAFLSGHGALTLLTDPPGAEVYAAPYVTRDRRLVTGEERPLGRTPLHAVPIAAGSHRLRLVAPGRKAVILPVQLERGEHWRAVPPSADADHAIALPVGGTIGPDECYVPAGWFSGGGDPHAMESLPRRRVWVDGFVIERHPLTYARLLDALDHLVDSGRAALAARIAPPPSPAEGTGSDGHLSVERDPDGRYRLEARRPGLAVDQWPVNMIDWHAAVAWAALQAELTGQPWRLPHDLEREKAARGVDGRRLPWGDFFEPTWAATVHARAHEPRRAPVDEFPTDESPYGVRGLTGNLRDWCRNVFTRDGQPAGDRLVIDPLPTVPGHRVVRGGAWAAQPSLCHPAGRFGALPDGRYFFVGVRLVRSLG